MRPLPDWEDQVWLNKVHSARMDAIMRGEEFRMPGRLSLRQRIRVWVADQIERLAHWLEDRAEDLS